jgi:hypothetical protein
LVEESSESVRRKKDPLAVAAVNAIQKGDLPSLKRLLTENPDLATARIGDNVPDGMSPTLLHVATDWPGHFTNGAETVALLVEARADVNARFRGSHAETPLHWAASSNDVEVLDALLDAGADIEAPGAVLGGGPPPADATGFGQWQAAQRLVERGAQTTLSDAATLGLMDRLEGYFAGHAAPSPAEIARAAPPISSTGYAPAAPSRQVSSTEPRIVVSLTRCQPTPSLSKFGARNARSREPFSHQGFTPRRWSVYGAQQAQPTANTGRSDDG